MGGQALEEHVEVVAVNVGVSYTWVGDMTKRYFGREGQRITRSAEPEPEEWIPVIEKVARGEISQRAAQDELTVSDGRVKAMLAHVGGEATDPAIARRTMDDKLADPANKRLYRKRQHSIEIGDSYCSAIEVALSKAHLSSATSKTTAATADSPVAACPP